MSVFWCWGSASRFRAQSCASPLPSAQTKQKPPKFYSTTSTTWKRAAARAQASQIVVAGTSISRRQDSTAHTPPPVLHSLFLLNFFFFSLYLRERTAHWPNAPLPRAQKCGQALPTSPPPRKTKGRSTWEKGPESRCQAPKPRMPSSLRCCVHGQEGRRLRRAITPSPSEKKEEARRRCVCNKVGRGGAENAPRSFFFSVEKQDGEKEGRLSSA